MGLMTRMLIIRNAVVKTLPESVGPAVVVTGDAGDHSEIREVYGPSGVWSTPPDGTTGVRLSVGASDRYGVIVASHHYKTPRPTLDKGETAIGSTSADGTEIKAKAIARADGTWEINGDSKRLITNDLVGILATFITALNASLATAGGTPVALDISAAITTTVKTGG